MIIFRLFKAPNGVRYSTKLWNCQEKCQDNRQVQGKIKLAVPLRFGSWPLQSPMVSPLEFPTTDPEWPWTVPPFSYAWENRSCPRYVNATIFFNIDFVRSRHLFPWTIVMLMVKAFGGIFWLTNYYENVTKLLRAWFSVVLHLTSWRPPFHLTFVLVVSAVHQELSAYGKVILPWTPWCWVGCVTCSGWWRVSEGIRVTSWWTLEEPVCDSLLSSPPWRWGWLTLKPPSAPGLWGMSLSQRFTFIIHEKSEWSNVLFFWSPLVQ